MAIQASDARRNGVSPIHGTYRGWGSARRPMLIRRAQIVGSRRLQRMCVFCEAA